MLEIRNSYLILDSFCRMMLSFSRMWRSSFGPRSSTEQVRKKREQLHTSRKGCRNPARQAAPR